MRPGTSSRPAPSPAGADWSTIGEAFSGGFRTPHELPAARRDVYRLVGRLQRKRLLSIARRRPRETARDTGFVSDIYEREYRPSTAEFVARRAKRRDVFLVNRRPTCVNGWFTFEYRAELLERALGAAGARTALEVGVGRGLILTLLALRRPELELSGLDLAAEGVARSVELAEDPPAELLRLSGTDVPTPEQEAALARLRFHQGDAAHMPFDDGAFDVSFTCLALEQMPWSVPEVLREMVRVTSGYCAFLEPFADANGVLGRAQLRALDYFRGRVASFRDFGLEPVYFTAAIPQKIRFRTGLLVARVAPRD
jgi:SAM-dependent methyltransferase